MAITRCQPDEGEHVAEVITAAFADNPITGWLSADLTDDVDAHALFRGYFRIWVDHALQVGEVETTGDGAAVALWLLPDSGDAADADSRLVDITGRYVDRFRALHAAMEAAHPEGEHHHLAFLAVHPSAQNQGHGTALLDHHHARLDALGLPAYLEASAPRNKALYERLGYLPTDTVIQPAGAPPMWPMVKPAGQ